MYKQYALIKDGVVLEYPVNPRVFNISINDFNIPNYWLGGELDGKEYVFCHNLEPSYLYDEMLVEKNPVFDLENNIWVRQYDVIKVDSETLAERREIAKKTVDEYIALLLSNLDEMENIISSLSPTKQLQWQTYKQEVLDIATHPNYPFNYVIPKRPDQVQSLKIEVARI